MDWGLDNNVLFEEAERGGGRARKRDDAFHLNEKGELK